MSSELVEKVYHSLVEIPEPPTRKTERDGGFGSTLITKELYRKKNPPINGGKYGR